jgi:hypothetical protein
MAGNQGEGTEDLDRNSGRAARSVAGLGAAAEAVAGTLGSLFTGAPKSVSSVVDSLNGLGAGIRIANGAISGFEGYVGVLQALSQSGIHFGNQIDEMILQAGAANMQIGDLARIAGESSERLAQLGAGANQGLQGFLSAQADFFENQRDLDISLRRLGLTVDDINDRFLTYDMISAISNVTDRRVTAERNKRATEFAEELDRLAKLTGKQADELAREVEAVAREGRVFAAMQDMPELGQNGENVRQQFATDLAGYAASYGPLLGDYMKDMVTQGFPDPNDPTMQAIHSFAPDLAVAFERYEQLMRQGNVGAARQQLERARIEAERLRTDRNVLSQVRYAGSGASVFASGLNEVVTQLNSGVAVSNSAIEAALREEGRIGPISAEEIARERGRIISEAQQRQQRDTTEGTAAIYQGYLDSLAQLQAIARETQRITVERSFAAIEGAVTDLARQIRGLDVTAIARSVEDTADDVIGRMFPRTSGQDDTLGRAGDMNRFLGTLSETFSEGSEGRRVAGNLVTEVGELMASIRDAGGTATQEQKDRLSAIATQMEALTNTLVSTNPDHGLSPEMVEAVRGLAGEGFNRGTMGAGKLFRDFGAETITALHGLEAVTTPDQMADIVRSSSAGTMQALVDQFNSGNAAAMAPQLETFARNNVSTLNGMLNTVRTQMSQSGANTPVNIDLTPLENAIMNLPARFKQPVEEALNSTLKPAMEQVASNTMRGAEFTERTYKNTRGMGQDYMRGA